MPQAPLICIAMPAYNEEACIADVVKQWVGAIKNVVASHGPNAFGRLIVVNDGSKDNTGPVLDKLASTTPELVVVHQPNGGHGRALMTAYQKALELNAQWVFQVDSDDQFYPEDLHLLWDARTTPDVAFIAGFRQKRQDALHRLVITRILRTFLLMIFGSYVTDANVPFRLIKGSYLRRLIDVMPPGVFAPNIFLIMLAKLDGKLAPQIPVRHRERETGAVSIVRWKLIKVCLRSMRELWEFRMTLGARLAQLQLPLHAAQTKSDDVDLAS